MAAKFAQPTRSPVNAGEIFELDDHRVGVRPGAEIAFREILPNALPPVLALSATIVAGAILTEAALSFLGLGNPNIATWGSMIAEGRSVLRSASYLSIIPGAALAVTVLGVHLFSEGLGKALGDNDVGAA